MPRDVAVPTHIALSRKETYSFLVTTTLATFAFLYGVYNNDRDMQDTGINLIMLSFAIYLKARPIYKALSLSGAVSGAFFPPIIPASNLLCAATTMASAVDYMDSGNRLPALTFRRS